MFRDWFKKKDKPPVKSWVFVNTVYIDPMDNLYDVRCPVCNEVTYVINNLLKACPACKSKLSGITY